jgi:hypothetical protein
MRPPQAEIDVSPLLERHSQGLGVEEKASMDELVIYDRVLLAESSIR